jgi:hypothetical protein
LAAARLKKGSLDPNRVEEGSRFKALLERETARKGLPYPHLAKTATLQKKSVAGPDEVG